MCRKRPFHGINLKNVGLRMGLQEYTKQFWTERKNAQKQTLIISIYVNVILKCWVSLWTLYYLELFPMERNIFRATAIIYILLSIYKTQKGFEKNDEEESSYSVVSIPIDLSILSLLWWLDCFNVLIHMATSLFPLSPQTDDVLFAINELRESHALMLCSHTYSYEEESKDPHNLVSSDKLKVFSECSC